MSGEFLTDLDIAEAERKAPKELTDADVMNAGARSGGFLDFMPQVNIARRSMRLEDAPGHAHTLAAAAGVSPAYEYPGLTAAGGPGAANMAAGANMAVGLLNRFPNSLLNELYPYNPPMVEAPFKRGFEPPQAKTEAGKALDAATTGIAVALPFALSNVSTASRVFELEQYAASKLRDLEALNANQARAGSAVKPMELTRPGATVKDVNVTETEWQQAQKAIVTEKHAILDRHHVDYDQRLLKGLRDGVIDTRKKAAAWLKTKGEEWTQKFEAATEGKDISREDAAQLFENMAQHMGLVDETGAITKTNLLPSEARVMRLRNAYRSAPEAGAEAVSTSGLVDPMGNPLSSSAGSPAVSEKPLSLSQLYKELLGTKQGKGVPHVDDHALGQAKNFLADYLTERGDADFLKLRTTYGPFAKFRDQIYALIKPQAGTFNTKGAVDDMMELLNTASDLNPTRAKNVEDLRQFLAAYREIDPELAAQLEVAARTKRGFNLSKAQIEAQAQQRIVDKAPVFDELRKRALETYDQTLQRLTKAVQGAKTQADYMRASGSLATFIRRYVLSPAVRQLPYIAKVGAGTAAGAYVASRVLAGRFERAGGGGGSGT